MGSFSIWHWLIVLVIVVLVFGTKRLKNVGKDVGEAVKGFKDGVRDDDRPEADRPPAQLTEQPMADPVRRAPHTADADAAAPRNDPPPTNDDHAAR